MATKEYLKEYNKRKREYKTDWEREKIRKVAVQLTMTDETPISDLEDTSRIGHHYLAHNYTAKKNKCRKCERLFSYAGAGDGIICSDCIDLEKNGPKPYFSQWANNY